MGSIGYAVRRRIGSVGCVLRLEQGGLGQLGACGDDLMRGQQQTSTVLECFWFDGSVWEGPRKYEPGSRNDNAANPSTEHRYCNTLSINVSFTTAENAGGIQNISRRGREMEHRPHFAQLVTVPPGRLSANCWGDVGVNWNLTLNLRLKMNFILFCFIFEIETDDNGNAML